MPLNASITFGSLTLDGGSGSHWIPVMVDKKVKGTLKFRFNENVTLSPIPGRAKEWEVTIRGVLSGNNRETDKSTLIGYDNGSIRQYVDGVHDGNYIITDLNFTNENVKKTTIDYVLVIRQYVQALP